MRVYLATTMHGLARLVTDGSLGSATAHAVTPALREWYVEGDAEELEYAALTTAARASLRMLADDPVVQPRRVVVAAEMADATARPAPEVERAAVRLTEPVTLRAVVSVHVDDTAAEDDVRRAVAALDAADAGDEDAQFVVDGVEDHELGWYAAQEIDALVELEA
jgi:hypothetical protein